MRTIQFVNGIPTTVVSGLSQYDESILVTTEIGVSGTGYNAAHTVFTLPSAETYDGTINELKVEVNGFGQVEGVEYNYDNNSTATTVTFITPISKDARVRFIKVT